MILIFLGSWRSTLIVAVSIPLSILTSLLALSALGETINIMTLGGLALAVGILVDDATVEVENFNRNLEQGKAIEQAILDGAAQIAVPALVATISICIVFVPMFLLSGVAKYLFVPLAEAVCFAMLASYLLSRTVVPTMAKYLLREHDPQEGERKRQTLNPFTPAWLPPHPRALHSPRRRLHHPVLRPQHGLCCPALPLPGRRLFPHGRQRPIQASHPRQNWHAH
jgi:multidrug efflux pump subunit AcrB